MTSVPARANRIAPSAALFVAVAAVLMICTLGSKTLPLTGTSVGEVGASLVISRSPVRVPGTEGLKLISMGS